jgi:hypothetical protein
VLFACEPAHEGEVRSGIERALHAGELTVPAPDDGPGTRWQVLSSAAGELEAGDQPVAARLAAGG